MILPVRKSLQTGDGMWDVVCTSGKPFYARLLPDPPMYARETPLEAYMAYLSTLANLS
jgi:hypothetical protein